jgi:hypothetical protein
MDLNRTIAGSSDGAAIVFAAGDIGIFRHQRPFLIESAGVGIRLVKRN